MIICIPLFTFIFLFAAETFLPIVPSTKRFATSDWLLNFIGLFVQGVVIPVLGFVLSLTIFPIIMADKGGSLCLGWMGSFLLNFLGVDLLYYFQHRSFHKIKYLWKFHRCHHASPKVDIWATSRNNLAINFMYVYLLVNPLLSYICDNPAAFQLSVMLTASLDIFRHSSIDYERYKPLNKLFFLLSYLLVMPKMHHLHHNAYKNNVNYGANLVIWDIFFKTFRKADNYPKEYQVDGGHVLTQYFYPFILDKK